MFIRDVFLTFSTQIAALLGNFLVGVILARALSVPERGIMVLVMTLPVTVASFANLGLPQANIYMIGRRKIDAQTVLGNALVGVTILGLLVVVGLSFFRELLQNEVLKGIPHIFWFPLLALVPFLLMDSVLLSILRARQRFDLFNLRLLASPLLMLLGFFTVLVIFRGSLNLAIRVYIGLMAVLVLIGFFLTRRVIPIRPTFRRQLTQDSVRFGLKSYLQNLFGALNYRLDVYLLAFFLAPAQVAFYGVATSLAEIAWYVPDSVGMVLYPRLSQSEEQDIDQITARVCRTTIAITAMIVLGLFATGWFIVPLIYGQAYAAVIPPLLALLPGIIVMALYKVLTRSFTSRDRQEISIFAASVALLFNIGLNLILIPRWGVVGAGVSSTVSYSLAGFILLFFFLRASELSWRDVLFPRGKELLGHLQWAKETL